MPGGAGGREEHGEEGVALGAHLTAVALGNRRPEDGVVAGLDVPVPLPEPLQQPGRALHVGEQEGDGTGGKVSHVRSRPGRGGLCEQ